MLTILTTEINSIADVRSFFGALHEATVAFHPDDSLTTYIQGGTGEPTFPTAEADRLDSLMERAFEVCKEANQDIYDIACEFV